MALVGVLMPFIVVGSVNDGDRTDAVCTHDDPRNFACVLDPSQE